MSKPILKTKYIENLQENQSGTDLFLVHSATAGKTSKGTTYLNLVLEDKTGLIDAKYWTPTAKEVEECKTGMVAMVSFMASMYNEKLQLTVQNMNVKSVDDIDPSLVQVLIRSSEHDINQMKAELKGYITKIQNKNLYSMVAKLFSKNHEQFMTHPAATRNHHNFYGGLLQHTLEMLKIAEAIGGVLPGLNMDLLYAGILIHDMGKTFELSGAIGTEYTIKGQLLGHISIMDAQLAEIAKDLDLLDSEEYLMLNHLLLSHHGKLEYGSPVIPRTLEAIVLSHIDGLDADFNAAQQALKNTDPGTMSEKVFSLGNVALYKPENL